MNQQQFEADLQAKISDLNSTLVPYGRVILPMWMINRDVSRIAGLVSRLGQAQTDPARLDLLLVIDTFISRYAFVPLI
jgi:hypothetical protein